MGYRNHIGSLPWEEYEKIKSMSLIELRKYVSDKKGSDPEDDYIGVYDIPEKRIFEFGKYCDIPPDNLFRPVFENNEVSAYFTEENDFYIVSKPFIGWQINLYTEKVKTGFEELIPDLKNLPDFEDKELVRKWYDHLRSVSAEWRRLTPYDLEDGDEVTKSWKYEYLVFELVRIYKHFDWKNNVMIYYGY